MERLAAGGVAGLLLPHAAVVHVDLERIHLLLVLSAQHFGRHDRAPRVRLALRVAMAGAYRVSSTDPEDRDECQRCEDNKGFFHEVEASSRRPIANHLEGRSQTTRQGEKKKARLSAGLPARRIRVYSARRGRIGCAVVTGL